MPNKVVICTLKFSSCTPLKDKERTSTKMTILKVTFDQKKKHTDFICIEIIKSNRYR